MNNLYEKYYELLYEWNKKFNLTSVIEKDKVFLLHFKDSILIEKEIPKGASLLDVGSGAGFPGIPLKIERPDLSVTLIDSVNKKVTFMNEVIKELGLKDIEALHKRIEDLKGCSFDVAVSRAVARLNVLTEYCLPFVKQGGIMIAYKSENSEEEAEEAQKAIEFLGGKIKKVVKKELSEEITRTFIIIEKIKQSPVGYPRGGNKPRIKPII